MDHRCTSRWLLRSLCRTFCLLGPNGQSRPNYQWDIPLSPFAAKVFYGTLACSSLGFVLGAAFLAFVRCTSTQRIAIADDGMLFPAGRWTSHECHVPFESVTAVKQVEVSGQAILYVYADGLRYAVARDMLPSSRDFEEIISHLETKVASG